MIFNLIRRFVVMTVAIPLAAAGARKLSDAIEARRGATRGSRLLRQGADMLHGRSGRRRRWFRSGR
jgi:hypothetical protein